MIKNCSLAFNCTQEWETLKKTEKVNVKFCNECKRKVYFVTSDEELEKYSITNQCVAFMDWNKINLWSTPFIQEIKENKQIFTQKKLKRLLPTLGFDEKKFPIEKKESYFNDVKEIIVIGIMRGYLLYRDVEPIMVEKKLAGQELYDVVEACNDIGILLFKNSPTSTGTPIISLPTDG
jgi:hypothetical protein